MNNFYIYRHIRLDKNTPFYVGKGTNRRAFVKAGRNIYWQNIADKYGFRVEIIIDDLSEQEALEKEQYFIEFYKNIGVCEANITLGGEGTVGLKHSDIAKSKISKSMKGKYIGKIHTKKSKHNMSLGSIGQKGSKGIKHNYNARKNMAIAHGAKPFTAYEAICIEKPIPKLQKPGVYNKGKKIGAFIIQKEAANKLNVITKQGSEIMAKTKKSVKKSSPKKKKTAKKAAPKYSVERPKVLIFDIETAPIMSYVWRLWDQNVGLNQIEEDWHIMSWSAKWLDDAPSKVMYQDQRNAPNIEDDKDLLVDIWNLLDEADIVITQNGKSFDQKKLNARFIINGFQPPSSYRHIDTKVIAKKQFGFTSNKLEYMSDKLCTKYKKLKHGKFPGFELWSECMKGNQEAWKEMEKYNKYDVLALEELYEKLIPWDNSINFSLYHNENRHVCKCGHDKFNKNGFYYTSSSKFQKYKCKKCGHETRDKVNLFSKEKRKSLHMETPKT